MPTRKDATKTLTTSWSSRRLREFESHVSPRKNLKNPPFMTFWIKVPKWSLKIQNYVFFVMEFARRFTSFGWKTSWMCDFTVENVSLPFLWSNSAMPKSENSNWKSRMTLFPKYLVKENWSLRVIQTLNILKTRKRLSKRNIFNVKFVSRISYVKCPWIDIWKLNITWSGQNAKSVTNGSIRKTNFWGINKPCIPRLGNLTKIRQTLLTLCFDGKNSSLQYFWQFSNPFRFDR